jgi:hypothetical protein
MTIESMLNRSVFVFLCLLLASGPLLADEPWMPKEAREAMILHLAKGLQEVDFGKEATPIELMTAAQSGVDGIIKKLEGDGVEAVLAKAPYFDGVQLPTTDNRYARAIGAFGLCSVTLHPELAKDSEERLFVTYGIVTVVILSAYLRDGFLKEGGSDQPLKDYLRSEAMEKVGREAQTNETLRNQITNQCGPILAGMLD